MSEQMIQIMLGVAFLGQVLVISYYLPSVVVGRARYVLEKYPPSSHPRLYGSPLEAAERALQIYRGMNFVVLALGLALLAFGTFFLPLEQLREWQEATDFASYETIFTAYMMLQFAPLLIAAILGFPLFTLKRRVDSRTTRRAELRRRSLSDFAPPALLGAAALTYLSFAVFIWYMGRFDFPWFGGYLNLVIVTGANLLFLGISLKHVYGKKKDPYQGNEDRARQIEFTLRTLLFVSIALTMYTAVGISLKALGFDDVTPIATSIYYQLLAAMSFREFRIDNVNFEVYREDPAAA